MIVSLHSFTGFLVGRKGVGWEVGEGESNVYIIRWGSGREAPPLQIYIYIFCILPSLR